jgi:hypothetical protein
MLKDMFGKLRKTKDLTESEFLIGKPDKTPSLRFLAYGLPHSGTSATHSFEEFELDDAPLRASVSFLNYNGIVVFAGTFEKIKVRSDMFQNRETYINCIESDDLDLRERELFTICKENKVTIFLVPFLRKDGSCRGEILDTDLFRRFLKEFHIPWDSSERPASWLNSQIPEFQTYIEQHGAAYVYFHGNDSNKEFMKVICGNDNTAVAFSVYDRVFFLPCVYPTTHEQALDAAESAIRAVISYRKRISKDKPQWISEFRFTQENSLLNNAKDLQQQLNRIETQIYSYGNYKGALCYRSDPLVDIVINIFEKFFGISLVKEDEFVEDASLKDKAGNRIAVFEIKGVNSNFSRGNVNQVDSHRERLSLQPDTPGILVMNTLVDANSLAEKDLPPHPDIIKKAVADNVLLIRTIDLLRFADGVEAELFRKEDLLSIIMSESGWLKVAENKYEVVKK